MVLSSQASDYCIITRSAILVDELKLKGVNNPLREYVDRRQPRIFRDIITVEGLAATAARWSNVEIIHNNSSKRLIRRSSLCSIVA